MIIKIKNIFINKYIFIIAEAGINHNGNMDIAKELIVHAKKCGANAIKFQTYKTEKLIVKNEKTKNIFNMLKKYELSYEDFDELIEFAKKQGIIFLTTPDDIDSLEYVISRKLPAIKIGSGEIDNYYFLKKAAAYKKPILLSTGASTLKEIDFALKRIRSINKKVILMHCISDYPTSIKDLNLNYIELLKKRYNISMGFSDHSKSLIMPIIAIAKGARVIEKHFTLDNNMEGPDHKMSLNINQFKIMIDYIRECEVSLGDGKRKLTKNEKMILPFIRKSIYSTKEIEKGDILNTENTILLRPQRGLKAKDYEYFLGKKFKNKKNPYKPIRAKDIE